MGKEKKKKEDGQWFKLRKTFFGVGKEFKRISWPSLKHVLWCFLIIFILTAFLVLLFYIVGDILIASHVIETTKNTANSSSNSSSS